MPAPGLLLGLGRTSRQVWMCGQIYVRDDDDLWGCYGQSVCQDPK